MFSLTYIGIIVIILSKILELGGIKIGTPELTTFVETFGVIIGGLIAAYGRFRVGGIKFWGGKVK